MYLDEFIKIKNNQEFTLACERLEELCEQGLDWNEEFTILYNLIEEYEANYNNY